MVTRSVVARAREPDGARAPAPRTPRNTGARPPTSRKSPLQPEPGLDLKIERPQKRKGFADLDIRPRPLDEVPLKPVRLVKSEIVSIRIGIPRIGEIKHELQLDEELERVEDERLDADAVLV